MASTTSQRWRKLLLAAIALLSTNVAHAQLVYEFEKVADTASPDYTSLFTPALNNNGQVAFHGDSGGNAIFRWDATTGATVTIAAVGGGINSVGFRPTINDDGDVAFRRTLTTGGSRITVGDGSSLTDYATSSDIFRDRPTIGDSGRVVAAVGVSTSRVVRTYLPLTFPTIVAQSGSSEQFATIDSPWIDVNASDTAVLHGFLQSTVEFGIYTNTDEALPPGEVASLSDGFTSFGNAPAINDSGMVAFTAMQGGVRHLYLGEAGAAFSPVADGNTFESLSNAAPSINSSNEIAFRAIVEGNHGIYLGGDPIADRIVQAGDTLDGGTVLLLAMSTHGLNDSSQVAFFATLDDDADGSADRDAIFLGTQAVPEPSAFLLGLTGIGLAAMAYHIRRRRQQRPSPGEAGSGQRHEPEFPAS